VSAARNAPAEPGASAYVSRGGTKLEHALDAFNLDVAGRRALDAGASTGGFTDCLLRRGAARVIAVDVAYGQLAWTLRTDERVRVVERTNVRSFDLRSIGEDPVDVVVADLSFISLRVVRDALLDAATPDADLVLLVKPQFEAPRGLVERGGVVRDRAVWAGAMRTVSEAYREARVALLGAAPSPLVGPAGNREFFLHLRRGVPVAAGTVDSMIERAIAEAP
jgi:23S rRNA (cytidine1920-2'-O)/16S rRNA (cytidine1409-2'-O)-methyltransferase